MPGDGRKIPSHLENPFDNLFIGLSSILNRSIPPQILHPNHITAASLATGLISAYMLYTHRYLLSAALLLLSYYLDCMDGNYARMYGLVTIFGDWFDHLSDITKYVALYSALAFNPGLTTAFKVSVFAITGTLMLTTYVHLGCQELSYQKQGIDTLTALEPLCPSPSAIQYTRYLGMGTWILSLFLSIVAAHIFSMNH